MPDRRAEVVLDVATGRAPASARPLPDRAFHILLLGDFSGRAREASSTPERAAVAVDRDNVDDVLARLRPSAHVRLDDDGPVVPLTFESIDDFHPDRLLERVPLLRSLLELRQQARAGRARLPREPLPRAASAPQAPRGGSLLEQILDDAAGPEMATSQAPPASPDELQEYIRRIVAPHLVPDADPRQTALAEQLDETLSTVLRAVLHQREFQALESVWRGVWFLVRRLETGPRLKVFVADVTHAELAADPGLLQRTAPRPRPADDTPWAVIVGLYAFDGSAADTALLSRIAAVARDLDAPFLAAAAPSLAGVASFDTELDEAELRRTETAFSQLRRDDAARYLGLALPRFLLRLPYDPREEPIEQLAFEELTSPPAHEHYLWGNSALLCALLLGEAFALTGWQMLPGHVPSVDGLPLHVYRDQGETLAKPCAEALLTDRVAMQLLERGVMPVLSQKAGGTVRIGRLQSIAEPAAALAGAWAAAPAT